MRPSALIPLGARRAAMLPPKHQRTTATSSRPAPGSRQAAGSKAGQRARRTRRCSGSQAHSAETGSAQRWSAARSSTGPPWTGTRAGPHPPAQRLQPRRPRACSPDHLCRLAVYCGSTRTTSMSCSFSHFTVSSSDRANSSVSVRASTSAVPTFQITRSGRPPPPCL